MYAVVALMLVEVRAEGFSSSRTFTGLGALVLAVMVTRIWRDVRRLPEPQIDPGTPDPWMLARAPLWVRGFAVLLAITTVTAWPIAIRETWSDKAFYLLVVLAFGYLGVIGRVPRLMLKRVVLPGCGGPRRRQ